MERLKTLLMDGAIYLEYVAAVSPHSVQKDTTTLEKTQYWSMSFPLHLVSLNTIFRCLPCNRYTIYKLTATCVSLLHFQQKFHRKNKEKRREKKNKTATRKKE